MGNDDEYRRLRPSLLWLTKAGEGDLTSTTLLTIRRYLIKLLESQREKIPGEALMAEGNSYASGGDWHSATWHYQQALDTLKEPSEALALRKNMVAIGYIKQGLGESAIPYLQEALEYITHENPDSNMIGTLYNNLGSAYKTMGHWSESRNWLCRVLEWSLSREGNGVLGYAHGHLCEVMAKLEDGVTASIHGEKSLAYCILQKDYGRGRETISTLVSVYREAGNQKRVNELLEIQARWP